jgi:signal transduction histidine kinase
LLAASFAALFQFGIETLRPFPERWRLLRFLPATLFFAWFVLSAGPLLYFSANTTEWRLWISNSARYLLGLPGAVVAGSGLLHQARMLGDQQHPLYIRRRLQVAAYALFGYAFVGGLIVSPATFFPASVLNQEQVMQLTGIPVQVFRSLLGLVLVIAMFRALDVFGLELDRQLVDMEEAQLLLAERERIGRELHDGTLQSIYAAGLLLSAAERSIRQIDGAPGLERVQQSIGLLNQSVTDIRRHIGELRPMPDQYSLIGGLEVLAGARHLQSMVKVGLVNQLPPDISLSPNHVRHLLAIANEALSNVIRHAQATEVTLTVTAEESCLEMQIQDNGRGFSGDYVLGYGLRTIQERARLLGGSVNVLSAKAKGVTIQVRVPWKEIQDDVAALAGG